MSATHSQDITTNMLALKKEPEMADSSSQSETRVARLETQIEQIASTVSGIATELKGLRTYVEAKFEQIDAKFERVNERISMLHVSMTEKFGEIKVWALTLGVGLGFGILTVIASAFHWI